MKVPFLDLQSPTKQINRAYVQAVKRILKRGQFILTPEVEKFEKEWARMVGTKYCVGVSNGADALYLTLIALGIGSGDEVITQGNAYNASVTSIMRAGAVPRFVDIDEHTLRIDTSKIERIITKKTKAIMPVHLYGQPADMASIRRIAKKHKLVVVEDAAQAHFAAYRGKRAGAWGDAGAFSFYPTKNLGAFGDGGAVTTNRREVYEKLLALRNLGQTKKNVHTEYGFNMRLDPLQAVCLSLKLPFLKQATAARVQAARRYDRLLQKANPHIVPLTRDKRADHVYHLYVVRVVGGSRAKLQQVLAQHGIDSAVHYPTPVYHQPFFKGKRDTCPVTDRTSNEILSLPFFPGITRTEQEYVVRTLTTNA